MEMGSVTANLKEQSYEIIVGFVLDVTFTTTELRCCSANYVFFGMLSTITQACFN